MGHINRKRMDVLRRIPGGGVDYNGHTQACGVCAVSKRVKASNKLIRSRLHNVFYVVTVDLMGPIKPAALGGYIYVTKFVDQHSRWKETFLIKTKPQALGALEHNIALVIPNNTRLIRLRADKGTEFTSSDFRQYCPDIGLSLDFASPNTPQQIGSNERAGRTMAGMVRCLLVDSGLPHFLWGRLMQTAIYVSNRVPRAAMVNETHRRRSMARTLISDTFWRSGGGPLCMWKRTSRCWRIVPGKDVLSATASTASRFQSTTHRRGVYVRAGTSFSSRTFRFA